MERAARPLAQATLDNGLTVLVREERKAPVVTSNIWVRVGSNFEDPGVLGWAHGIEHMMFKGTRRRKPGDAAREVREAGGTMNAATGYETTNYHVTVPTRGFRLALDILSDAIRNSVFDAAELDRERDVIIEENRMYRDQPGGYGHTWEKLLGLAFRVSNYRRHIGGPDESLRSTPRDAILAFRDRYYVPGNAALVIVGDVSAGEAIEAAREAFGGWPAAPVPVTGIPIEPPQREPRALAVGGAVAKTYLKMGWHAGPETSRETLATLIFLRLLARGRSSRIYQELLEKRGLLSEISVLQEAGARESFVVLDMVTDAGKVEALVEAVGEEIQRFGDEAVPQGDLDRARNFMIRSHVLGHETVEAQAHALGHYFMTGDVGLADRFPEDLETVTPLDILGVARRVFRGDACSLLALHPEGAPAPRLAAPLALRRPDGVVPAVGASGTSAPRGGGFERIRLENGITLVYKRRPALPAVSFGAFVRGGASLETEATNGLAFLTQRCMVKGTASRTSEMIARESELCGASIAPSSGPDSCGLSVTTLTRFFDPAFEIFADALLHPSFPAPEFERERELALAEIAQEEDEPFQKTSRAFQRLLFGGDPYGLPIEGSDASVRALRREDLVAFHARLHRAGNLVLVFVGDVDRDHLVERVRSTFSALPAGTVEPPPARSPDGAARREVVLEKDVKQEVILLGFEAPAARHEDRDPLVLLCSVMSGMGNRLFVALRDREALCYYTGMYYRSLARGGVIAAYIGTSPDKEARALAGLEREIRAAALDGITPHELERARKALIGNFAIGRQTNAAEAGLAARYEILGLGFEEAERFEERMLAVTREDVSRAARRWLQLERRALAITRPARRPAA